MEKKSAPDLSFGRRGGSAMGGSVSTMGSGRMDRSYGSYAGDEEEVLRSSTGHARSQSALEAPGELTSPLPFHRSMADFAPAPQSSKRLAHDRATRPLAIAAPPLFLRRRAPSTPTPRKPRTTARRNSPLLATPLPLRDTTNLHDLNPATTRRQSPPIRAGHPSPRCPTLPSLRRWTTPLRMSRSLRRSSLRQVAIERHLAVA